MFLVGKFTLPISPCLSGLRSEGAKAMESAFAIHTDEAIPDLPDLPAIEPANLQQGRETTNWLLALGNQQHDCDLPTLAMTPLRVLGMLTTHLSTQISINQVHSQELGDITCDDRRQGR